MLSSFSKLSSRLNTLVDADPNLAIQEARDLVLEGLDRLNMMSVRAATLVNAGASLVNAGASLGRKDAIDEGVDLYRKLHNLYPRFLLIGRPLLGRRRLYLPETDHEFKR
jgi:hypothetical protein